MEAVSEEAAMRKLKGEGSIVLELSEAFDLDNASWNITIGNPVKKRISPFSVNSFIVF